MSIALNVEGLRPYQLERRNKIVRAAYTLIVERDLDDIQMREVAAKAGVSLGTLYRYFSSKDHLSAVLLRQWGEAGWARATVEGAPTERFRARLLRSLEALEGQQGFFKIVSLVSRTNDPAAIAEFEAFGASLDSVLWRDLEALAPARAQQITRIAWALITDLLSQVVQGRLALGDCVETLNVFCDMVERELRLAV